MPIGNVAISRDGYRLIADQLSYDAQESVFAVETLRTGQWPIYISGVSAGGTTENITFKGATIYYGNPGRFTPNVSSDQIDFTSEEGGKLKMGSYDLQNRQRANRQTTRLHPLHRSKPHAT